MKSQKNYFYCYSINLLREIKANGFKYITKGINPSSGKTFWQFEITPELKQILDKWNN